MISKLLFFICLTSVLATNFTWIGSNNVWNNILNWDPNGIPSFIDNVLIPFNSKYSPILTGNEEFLYLENYFAVNIINSNFIIHDVYNLGNIIIYNSTGYMRCLNNGSLVLDQVVIKGNITNLGVLQGKGVLNNVISYGIVVPDYLNFNNFYSFGNINYFINFGYIYGNFIDMRGFIDIMSVQNLLAGAQNFIFNASSNRQLVFKKNKLYLG